MVITTNMCHSRLMIMLLHPEMFQDAVTKYEATAPDFYNEGFAGYMSVDVTFHVKNLESFTELYEKSYRLPSDSSEWYSKVYQGKVVV